MIRSTSLCLILSVSAVITALAAQPTSVVSFPLPAFMQADPQAFAADAPPVVLAGGTVFMPYFGTHQGPITNYLVSYAPLTGESTLWLNLSGSVIGDMTPVGNGSSIAVAAAQIGHPSSLGAAVVEFTETSPGGGVTNVVVEQSWTIDRLNSTARQLLAVPELNMVVFLAQLPSNAQVVEMVAVATNTTASHNAPVVLWNRTWATISQTATLHYYAGMIYFFQASALIRVNAHTGIQSATFIDPCGHNTPVATVWNFAIASFDVEAGTGASLDAFVLYATTASDNTVVCRFSHTSGTKKWSVDHYGYWIFDDVYGGGGNIYLTGHEVNVTTGATVQYITLVHNATTGHMIEYPYAHNVDDSLSYPRLLPSYMNAAFQCPQQGPAMVQVSYGSTYAYCASAPSQILWQAHDIVCYRTPVIVASAVSARDGTFVVCLDNTHMTLTMLSAFTGAVVWTYNSPETLGVVTDGVYLYVADARGAITQIQVGPADPQTNPVPIGSPSGGLSGGQKAAIVIVVLVAVGAGVFAVTRYQRLRSVRREVPGGHAALVNGEEVVEVSSHVVGATSHIQHKDSPYGAIE